VDFELRGFEMHNFRKLKVYEKALGFTKTVRLATRKFPKDELFSLTSQFRRAADSIVLNIAEGAGNRSDKEFAKFLDYSIRSGHECIGCMDVTLANEFISEKTYKLLFGEVDEIIAMLIGFQRSLLT
jgi:four helix bundle protein